LIDYSENTHNYFSVENVDGVQRKSFSNGQGEITNLNLILIGPGGLIVADFVIEVIICGFHANVYFHLV
jgi:hypothetical protein